MNNEQFSPSREHARLFTLRSAAHVERFQRFTFSAARNSRLNASGALSPTVCGGGGTQPWCEETLGGVDLE